MKSKWGSIFSLIVCAITAATLIAPAQANGEIFVVSTTANGDANYLLSNDDGSLAAAEILQLTADSGISAYPISRGNALGDFDGDGDYDYIAAYGYGGGEIYLFEKLADGNQFAAPISAGAWQEGMWAMDMAVGDFNGDGNQDFVMSYMQSPNSGIYLGNGNFGFEYSSAEGSAPSVSSGADAADFNNDGFDDFVIAPNSNEPIYVNLGSAEGTFTKLTVATHDGNPVFGIAAADFTNDGQADIVTAASGILIIYQGNGDGTFQYSATHAVDLNDSFIDNHDFNGDGIQDLVVTKYGTTLDNVAVLLGNGDGTFTHDATYSGATYGYIEALTCPPIEPEVNLLDTLTETDAEGGEFSVGADDSEASKSAEVSFTPRKLNSKSRGKWIMATIKLPAGYDARQIDPDSVQMILGGASVKAHTHSEHGFFKKFLKKFSSGRKLSVKFDRQAVISAIGEASGRINVGLEFSLNGKSFSGSGAIDVLEKQHKKFRHAKKYGRK